MAKTFRLALGMMGVALLLAWATSARAQSPQSNSSVPVRTADYTAKDAGQVNVTPVHWFHHPRAYAAYYGGPGYGYYPYRAWARPYYYARPRAYAYYGGYGYVTPYPYVAGYPAYYAAPAPVYQQYYYPPTAYAVPYGYYW